MYRGTRIIDALTTLKGRPTFVTEHQLSTHAMRQHRGVLQHITVEDTTATFIFTNGVFTADLSQDVMASSSPF